MNMNVDHKKLASEFLPMVQGMYDLHIFLLKSLTFRTSYGLRNRVSKVAYYLDMIQRNMYQVWGREYFLTEIKPKGWTNLSPLEKLDIVAKWSISNEKIWKRGGELLRNRFRILIKTLSTPCDTRETIIRGFSFWLCLQRHCSCCQTKKAVYANRLYCGILRRFDKNDDFYRLGQVLCDPRRSEISVHRKYLQKRYPKDQNKWELDEYMRSLYRAWGFFMIPGGIWTPQTHSNFPSHVRSEITTLFILSVFPVEVNWMIAGYIAYGRSMDVPICPKCYCEIDHEDNRCWCE